MGVNVRQIHKLINDVEAVPGTAGQLALPPFERLADATGPWAFAEAPLVTTDLLPTLTDESRRQRWEDRAD